MSIEILCPFKTSQQCESACPFLPVNRDLQIELAGLGLPSIVYLEQLKAHLGRMQLAHDRNSNVRASEIEFNRSHGFRVLKPLACPLKDK